MNKIERLKGVLKPGKSPGRRSKNVDKQGPKKEEVREESPYIKRNRKVAQNRGASWRKKLIGSLNKKGLQNPLKEHRVKRGLTQVEMTKRLGHSSKTSYNRIEQGIISIPLKKAQRIANILKTDVSVLFNKSGARFKVKEGK